MAQLWYDQDMTIDGKIIQQVFNGMEQGRQITFLVGAGISAESGIPTFRGNDGFWTKDSENYQPEEIATFRMFRHDPKRVWTWFLKLGSTIAKARPNQNHRELKQLELLLNPHFSLVSQNVDGLHRKAGQDEESTFLIHGDAAFVRCSDGCTEEIYPFPGKIDLENRDGDRISNREWKFLKCPACNQILRPHALLFDEYYNEKYYRFDSVLDIASRTAILFILGTSGATTLPQLVVEKVLSSGGWAVEVNLSPTFFSERLKQQDQGFVIPEKSRIFLEQLREQIQVRFK